VEEVEEKVMKVKEGRKKELNLCKYLETLTWQVGKKVSFQAKAWCPQRMHVIYIYTCQDNS